MKTANKVIAMGENPLDELIQLLLQQSFELKIDKLQITRLPTSFFTSQAFIYLG